MAASGDIERDAPMTDTELLSRMEALEMKYAYQERLIEELNALVTDHQKTIDAMSIKIRDAFQQLAENRDRTEKPPHERPPHY
jgi:uncharacterized coiled-coil protein SlyX